MLSWEGGQDTTYESGEGGAELTQVPPPIQGPHEDGSIPLPLALGERSPLVGGFAPGGDSGIQVLPPILFVMEENSNPSGTDGFLHSTKHGNFTEHRTPVSYLLLAHSWR